MTAAQLFRDALARRLHAALTVLGEETDPPDAEALVVRAGERAAEGGAAEAWLVYAAIAGQFPTPTALAAFRRELQLAPADERVAAMIATAGAAPSIAETAQRSLKIVVGGVLVDVGHSATTDHNTGIQRVVRRTLPHWADRPHLLVAWTAEDGGYRELDEAELSRVLRWGEHTPSGGRAGATDTLVVPWRSTVVLPEVATPGRIAPLACLAEHSGSEVGVIGYDAIPLISADLVAPAESERFAHYLTIVKHSTVVAGISAAAASEFEGFSSALGSQGLAGPRVRTVSLADDLGPTTAARLGERRDTGAAEPLILSVGSHEPRKNQDAVLAAASMLHDEGLRFRLVFVGGGSRGQTGTFDRELARLRAAGMNVESHRRMADHELFELYATARFSVFASLHEGYGLPVVESMSHGAPVLTSNYGSLAEIAAEGGCLQVDPRSIPAIAQGMRTLLQDDAVLEELRRQIAVRPGRSWRLYADELWAAVVEGGPQ